MPDQEWISRSCIQMPILYTQVSFISFFVFGHFWQQSYENTKILRNLCLHFVRQDRKKRRENPATKVGDQNTKNQKTKIWDERNKND